MIAQTPVRVLRGTIARCKTPFSNRVLHAVPPRSLQSYKDSESLGKKGYSEIMNFRTLRAEFRPKVAREGTIILIEA